METTTVRTGNVKESVEKLTSLARRAKKLGVPVPTWTVGQDSVCERTGKPVTTITVTTEIVKVVGEWKLLGLVEFVPVRIVREVPGESIPVAPDAVTSKCDHCQASRRRDSVAFLQNVTDGRVVQCGRNCLRDYVGWDPKVAAFAWDLVSTIKEFDDGMGGYGLTNDDGTECLIDYLTKAASCVRRWGWVSGAAARDDVTGRKTSTANLAGLDKDPETDSREWSTTDGDTEKAKAAMVWAAALTDEQVEGQTYLFNIRSIARSTRVHFRTQGFAASILVAFDRDLAKRQEATRRAESQHVGEVGKRQTFQLVLKKGFVFETQYGVSCIYLFEDAQGNTFKWKASSASLEADGTAYEVTGTIKAHEEYKGRKQTVLTRCKCIETKATVAA